MAPWTGLWMARDVEYDSVTYSVTPLVWNRGLLGSRARGLARAATDSRGSRRHGLSGGGDSIAELAAGVPVDLRGWPAKLGRARERRGPSVERALEEPSTASAHDSVRRSERAVGGLGLRGKILEAAEGDRPRVVSRASHDLYEGARA